MTLNSLDKVLKIRNNLAVKINPVFYQLLNESYEGWYFERFINLVSYEKQGQHIIDFVDNNSSVYESRVQTVHLYGAHELPPTEFVRFIQKSISNNQFVNLWCDEYYIKDSIRYNEHHFVHPLTVYGVEKGQAYCEFFSTTRGMTLIKVPMDDLKRAYYSVGDHYTYGASYDVLKKTLSTYEVKEYNQAPFKLTVFTQELSYYLHGQPNPYKEVDCTVCKNNIAYGMAYYNDLLEIVRDDFRYTTLPYKCLFDLHLHKLFLVERLKYIRGLIEPDDEFDAFIYSVEKIAKKYEQINMLNIKYNAMAGIRPNVLSSNSEFRGKLTRLLEQAYEAEANIIPRIIAYLTNTINEEYKNRLNDFSLEQSEGGITLYPRFNDYVSQISIRIENSIDDALPVKVQLSNGYFYYPDNTGHINTYSFRPTKLEWIKILNCKSISLLCVVKLNEQTEAASDSCSLVNWRPLNHIDNWQFHDETARFNISGLDPYLVCDGVHIDADKYSYITIEYETDDISDKAQMYFMTDACPMYSQSQLYMFHICQSGGRYAYKLNLGNLPTWKGIVTLLRLDPVHYPAQYQENHIYSECSIYRISVSNIPFIYSNEEDYTRSQCINQWEYCGYKDGVVHYLVYDSHENLWGDRNEAHIGMDYQKSTDSITVSRNWRCPAKGKYRIVFSAECDIDTDVKIMLDDDITLFYYGKTNLVQYEDIVQLEENSLIRFVNGEGNLKKISVKIQKITNSSRD